MRQVYELSANLTEENKNEAVQFTLGNAMDRIEGPATLNVVRVRCPTQFTCFKAGALNISGVTPLIEVASYSTPSDAIRNYEMAFQKAVFDNATPNINQLATGGSYSFSEYVLKNNTQATIGAGTFKIDLPNNEGFYEVGYPALAVDASVTFSAYVRPGVIAIPDFALGHKADTSGLPSHLTKTVYDFISLPKLDLNNGVLELRSEKAFDFDDVAAYRLKLGEIYAEKDSVMYPGVAQPAFNDVRRIVMTLTPTTQRIIAMDASSTNKIYDNVSISFTVDDDPTETSAMAMYSLSSDFLTNSLRIEGGTVESMSVHLQRCIFDPTTGVLSRPEPLYLPATNNFVEVKLVADDEPTAKRQRLPSQQPLIPPQMQRRILPGVPTPEGMRG